VVQWLSDSRRSSSRGRERRRRASRRRWFSGGAEGGGHGALAAYMRSEMRVPIFKNKTGCAVLRGVIATVR